jgi:DNA sulfur modification protein DndD
MKIEKITIHNFRSYYGENSIEFNDGLTLVIGDNGDGKTTFFEALEWLFDTRDAENKTDNRNYPNFISAKRLSELSFDEKDVVRVEMFFDHDGKKLIEKQFEFSKNGDKVSLTNFHFIGYEDVTTERRAIAGKSLLERCFDTAIRKYCLFKGESELNIFDNQDAMNLLLKYFSDIKDFDTYLKFTEYAESESKKSLTNFLKKDEKNERAIKKLEEDLSIQRKELEKITANLNNHETEAKKYTGYISNIEKNANISSMLNDLNNRLDSLKNKQKNLKDTLNENYTIRLLDDKWILCGLSPIFKEYQEKINADSKEKRRLEDEDKRQEGKVEGKQETIQDFRSEFVPLSIGVPDANTMRELIEDEVCKVCGRPAPKGSDAYNFMVNKLNEFLKNQEAKQEMKEKSHFPNNFIRELEQESIRLGNLNELSTLQCEIKDSVSLNETQKNEIDKLQENINQTEEDKIKLIAQSDNLTEQELKNQYQNITNWVSKKTDAEKEIPLLKKHIEVINNKIEKLQQEYNAIAKDSQSSIYVKINSALEKINNAFKSAKNKNTDEFFHLLEEKANQYLVKLNIEDFHGIIKLEQKLLPNNEKTAKIVLRDNQGNVIYNPNTALKTTVYMSVLFGISEITNRERGEDYPLIFDAPTSSFSDAKESDFFNVISKINKQCIIVTKSFLTKDGNTGRNSLDINQIKSLECAVYRIEKVKPFDEKDLSTIRTTIESIK